MNKKRAIQFIIKANKKRIIKVFQLKVASPVRLSANAPHQRFITSVQTWVLEVHFHYNSVTRVGFFPPDSLTPFAMMCVVVPLSTPAFLANRRAPFVLMEIQLCVKISSRNHNRLSLERQIGRAPLYIYIF